MLLTGKFEGDPRLKSLPIEVYETIVRSLHGDVRTLLAGKAASLVGGLIAYEITRSIELLTCIFCIILISTARVWHVHAFNQIPEGTLGYRELASHERRYKLLSTLYVSMLGIIGFLGFAVSPNEVVHLVLVTICMGNMAGIAGRNFANLQIVMIQSFALVVPPVLGMLLFGNVYHVLLACLLLPFMLAIHSIARHLRSTLMEATFQALDNKTIADRFEVALENASHGMAMVDSDGVFSVVNERFSELFGLPEDFPLVGSSLTEITVFSLKNQPNAKLADAPISERVHGCLIARERSQFTHPRPDGTIIEVTFNPMNEGAGVIVLEDVSARVKSEQEIRQLANFDPLTHLPNRRYFDLLARKYIGQMGTDAQYALLFVDLDNFKTINDSLGHPVGDKLLCSVSLRMKSCLPKDALICRFGGDEFILLLPGMGDRDTVERFAREMMAEITKPVLIDGHLIIIGSSVGVALAPQDSTDLEKLQKMADLSLYQAKAAGRDHVCFYSDELGERIEHRREMELELRRAVQRGELTVAYQPLIDLKTRQIACCEALVRWHHPEHGFIPPSEFIPMAEEIGLINRIGRFVLDAATRECATWPGDVRVAVNVSSLQFKQSDVVATVTAALKASGLKATRLEIEVTESTALEDLAETSRILRTLAQGGVRISLDDFGTGFSSLSYLHLLPLHKVKIDRSFLESIRDDERSLILLSGVTRLAADLGLQVIMEGVEEEDQLSILLERVHIDQAQGYLFSKPLSGEAIRQLIAESNDPGSVRSVREHASGIA